MECCTCLRCRSVGGLRRVLILGACRALSMWSRSHKLPLVQGALLPAHGSVNFISATRLQANHTRHATWRLPQPS